MCSQAEPRASVVRSEIQALRPHRSMVKGPGSPPSRRMGMNLRATTPANGAGGSLPVRFRSGNEQTPPVQLLRVMVRGVARDRSGTPPMRTSCNSAGTLPMLAWTVR